MDTHIYASARGVLGALARHDCGLALAWCEANRPRLRKQKSKLEFKLRVQARPPQGPCDAHACDARFGVHRAQCPLCCGLARLHSHPSTQFGPLPWRM